MQQEPTIGVVVSKGRERSESTIRKIKEEQKKEQHYYLKTNQGEFKKTRWTQFSVEQTRIDLEEALRERKRFQKLLNDLENQYREDKRKIEDKEKQRRRMEAKLERWNEKVLGRRTVTIYRKGEEGSGNSGQQVKVGGTWYEFVEMCTEKLKMDKGQVVVWNERNEMIEALEYIQDKDKLYLELEFM